MTPTQPANIRDRVPDTAPSGTSNIAATIAPPNAHWTRVNGLSRRLRRNTRQCPFPKNVLIES